MEGRTIARPDQLQQPRLLGSHVPFNGGPDNCPARPVPYTRLDSFDNAFNGGPDNCPARLYDSDGRCDLLVNPSMEGRTIARPDRHS